MSTGWFQKKEAKDPSGATASAKPPKPVRAPVKDVRVSHLLTEKTVIVSAEGVDKNALLEALAKRLCESSGLSDQKGILAKIQEREQGISTTLDTGLSLPHVRLDGLSDIVAALAIVGKGIPDPKQPDLTIRIMFLFFSPNKPESFPVHLQLLRKVSSLFQPALIEDLSRVSTPAAALELIRKIEA